MKIIDNLTTKDFITKREKLRKHAPHHFEDKEKKSLDASLSGTSHKKDTRTIYYSSGNHFDFVKDKARELYNLMKLTLDGVFLSDECNIKNFYIYFSGKSSLKDYEKAGPFKILSTEQEINPCKKLFEIGANVIDYDYAIVFRNQNIHQVLQLPNATFCNAIVLLRNKDKKWTPVGFQLEDENFVCIDKLIPPASTNKILTTSRSEYIKKLPYFEKDGKTLETWIKNSI